MPDDGRIRWFGQSWGAPICRDCDYQPTPVGETCLTCGRTIEKMDSGVTMICVYDTRWKREPAHLACFLGSLGIQQPYGMVN